MRIHEVHYSNQLESRFLFGVSSAKIKPQTIDVFQKIQSLHTFYRIPHWWKFSRLSNDVVSIQFMTVCRPVFAELISKEELFHLIIDCHLCMHYPNGKVEWKMRLGNGPASRTARVGERFDDVHEVYNVASAAHQWLASLTWEVSFHCCLYTFTQLYDQPLFHVYTRVSCRFIKVILFAGMYKDATPLPTFRSFCGEDKCQLQFLGLIRNEKSWRFKQVGLNQVGESNRFKSVKATWM